MRKSGRTEFRPALSEKPSSAVDPGVSGNVAHDPSATPMSRSAHGGLAAFGQRSPDTCEGVDVEVEPAAIAVMRAVVARKIGRTEFPVALSENPSSAVDSGVSGSGAYDRSATAMSRSARGSLAPFGQRAAGQADDEPVGIAIMRAVVARGVEQGPTRPTTLAA